MTALSAAETFGRVAGRYPHGVHTLITNTSDWPRIRGRSRGEPTGAWGAAPENEGCLGHLIPGGVSVTVSRRRAPARASYPRTPANQAELSTVDHELSTLYDRLLAAQQAAEMAGWDDTAEMLRGLRQTVHARLVVLDEIRRP